MVAWHSIHSDLNFAFLALLLKEDCNENDMDGAIWKPKKRGRFRWVTMIANSLLALSVSGLKPIRTLEDFLREEVLSGGSGSCNNPVEFEALQVSLSQNKAHPLAFLPLHHNFLRDALVSLGVPPHLISALRGLWADS